MSQAYLPIFASAWLCPVIAINGGGEGAQGMGRGQARENKQGMRVTDSSLQQKHRQAQKKNLVLNKFGAEGRKRVAAFQSG